MSGYYKDEHRYDDMLDMPHHKSAERAHMSLHDRAAQFAPFAALSGHEEAIEETARLTDQKIILDEMQLELLNQKLQEIVAHIDESPVVAITYFRPDAVKEGGSYLTDVGKVKKIDECAGCVVFESGMKIAIDQISQIEDAE